MVRKFQKGFSKNQSKRPSLNFFLSTASPTLQFVPLCLASKKRREKKNADNRSHKWGFGGDSINCRSQVSWIPASIAFSLFSFFYPLQGIFLPLILKLWFISLIIVHELPIPPPLYMLNNLLLSFLLTIICFFFFIFFLSLSPSLFKVMNSFDRFFVNDSRKKSVNFANMLSILRGNKIALIVQEWKGFVFINFSTLFCWYYMYFLRYLLIISRKQTVFCIRPVMIIQHLIKYKGHE